MAGKFIFRVWFQPYNSRTWELLKKEAELQVGLRAKPKWIPLKLWQLLVRFVIRSKLTVELPVNGNYESFGSLNVEEYTDELKKLAQERDKAEEELRLVCCYCRHAGDILHYYAKVGGSDQPVEQIVCRDIDACLERKK